MFDPLRRWLDQLPPRPDTQAVAALAARHPVYTANGHSVRFVPPQDDGLAYECRIGASGEVETRPNHWHDYFNALVWLSFPQTKVVVSAAHVEAMQAPGAARGTVRDALTHFDECGIAVLSDRPDLLDLLRGFQWKALFVEHRAAVLAQMRFVIFGHATYEALLNPFRGLTAKAMLLEVTPAELTLPPAEWVPTVDRKIAAKLKSGAYQRPRDFQPLPLLGIPGVTPASEEASYYDDTWQFRPGRGVRLEIAAECA